MGRPVDVPLDFAAWTRSLAARGLTVVPPSHRVPIDVWALLATGGALHLWCRGTAVVLEQYADADLYVSTPPAVCGCGCGAQATPPQTAGRFAVRPGARPVRAVRWDGREERGWRAYEAGLLDVPAAAALLDELLDRISTLPVAPRSEPGAAQVSVESRPTSKRSS